MRRAGKHLGLAAATFTAGLVFITGCGSNSADTTTSTTAITSTGSTTSSSEPAQGGVIPTSVPRHGDVTGHVTGDIGSEQKLATDTVTARITVKNVPKVVVNSEGSRIITFPATIVVESGKLSASPGHWRLITLSGQQISGYSINDLPTAFGDADITTTAEGLIPFSDQILTNEVSLARIEYRTDITSTDPTLQWKFPTPPAVSSIPAS